MGLVSLLEDAAERLYDGLFSSDEAAVPFEPREPHPTVQCPVCGNEYQSPDALVPHLSAHTGFDVYLRVGGAVVSDERYLDAYPESLVLHYTPDQYTRATVAVNGKNSATRALLHGAPWDLSEFVPVDAGQHVITVEVVRGASAPRRLRVTCDLSTPPVRVKQVLSSLARQMAHVTEHADEPDWTALASEIHSGSWSASERRYLQASFDYCFAVWLDDRGDNAARGHYERAYGELREFSDGPARAIQRALAFKMNLFEQLTNCPPGSAFARMAAFFGPSQRARGSKALVQQQSKSGTLRVRLAMPELQRNILRAAQACMDESWRDALSTVEPYVKGVTHTDPNDAVKLHLIAARAHRAIGQHAEAKSHYRRLRNHSWLGAEARAHL